MKVIIIGTGIGGIATAIRLAVKGHQVKVFEANSYAGGKLSEFHQGDYRFDAGPSLFTMPQFIDELFRLAGKNPADYFQYVRLPEICRYFWEDGSKFTVPANIEEFAHQFEKTIGEPAQNISSYLQNSAFKYDVLSPLFLEKSMHHASTWLSKKALRGYINMPKMGIFGTLNKANEQHFQQEKTVQLFNRYATYNGSDPYQTPATMSIIPHLEYNVGAFFPKGGMYAITESLVKLATELGVQFHYNCRVSEIFIEQKQAKGIKFKENKEDKEHFLPADLVVSNMDITATYRKLLPNEKHPHRLLNQPKSGSGIIYYWGIKKAFPALGLHNIFFSANYKTEFEHQFKHKNVYHDSTIYLNISSKYAPNDAPKGSENWFLLINAPANENQDWDKIIEKTRENVIQKLSRNLGEDIRPLIENESILDPRTIESRTSSVQGALYGNSSNNRFAAFLRHANFSNKIKGLYFVGGSVHPGGGIPLALSSAKIVADLVGAIA